VRELGPTGVQKRTALYAQSRSGGNRAGKGGKAISLMSCKTWERQKEGADMGLEEIKGELYLCLLVTFYVNALTSAVVTERVPINTNFSLLLQATVLSVPTPLGPASLSV